MSEIHEMYDFFKRSSLKLGDNKGDRILNKRINKFDQILEISPNSFDITVDGVKTKGLIQDIHFNDETSTDKHLFVKEDFPIDTGNYVVWNGETWIVIHKEIESVKAKQAVRIKYCDNYLTWQEDGIIKQMPVATEDKTSPFSDGMNKTGGKFVRPADQISAIINSTELVKNSIKLNSRYIFDNNELKVFRLTRIKAMPSLNLYELVLKKDGYNPVYDNLELNVADFYKSNEKILDPYIEGVDKISRLDDYEVFTLENYNGDNISWSFDTDNVSVIREDLHSIELCVKDKNVFESFKLKALDSNNDIIASKLISTTYM